MTAFTHQPEKLVIEMHARVAHSVYDGVEPRKEIASTFGLAGLGVAGGRVEIQVGEIILPRCI